MMIIFLSHLNSVTTSCLAVADIPFENIARHETLPQHPAAAAGLVVGGRVRHSV